MDRLDQYRQWVRQLLTDLAEPQPSQAASSIESQMLFDSEHDHYQLLDIGWDGMNRVYTCFIHIDIKGGKILIQRNMTEADLAQDFVKFGVPKDDIILGLHPPYKRPHTGYGVA